MARPAVIFAAGYACFAVAVLATVLWLGATSRLRLPFPIGPHREPYNTYPAVKAELAPACFFGGDGEEGLAHDLRLDTPAQAPDAFRHRAHLSLAREVMTLSTVPNLLIYGDSITEYWRRPQESELFRTALLDRYGSALALGVPGGTAQQLLWRLQHGEMPSGRPRACVVHIGINDLGFMGAYRFIFGGPPGGCDSNCDWEPSHHHRRDAENVYFAIKAVLQELCRFCPAPIVVTTLFPTGQLWPQGPFGETVPYLNRLLVELAGRSNGRLEAVSCPHVVLSNDTGGIDPAAMPDFLHPSLEARRAWVGCLTPVLDRLIL